VPLLHRPCLMAQSPYEQNHQKPSYGFILHVDIFVSLFGSRFFKRTGIMLI
jgi:hypothetical protein